MSPLGQALAAIIELLIAAIAEHAREHPMLAWGCRASIRQLEKLIRRFDAMVQEWQATQSQKPTRRAGFSPPRPTHAIPLPPKHEGEPARRPVALWNPARAPPARCSPAHRPQGAARARPRHA
jgi:hypothetical protein